MESEINPDKLINLTKINKNLKNNADDYKIKKTKTKPKDNPATLNSEDIIEDSNK